ncbi:MAG: proline--tRNA ligase [Patescibacteria group bacterium]|jgi:prolyl-tRNA synthetase|nr:proline--tRNA ligase [Patescibacteria group bacterium]
MKVSKLFTKTSKTYPADEAAKNAQLLIQAGFVHKEMAGVYAYLPLGWKVIEKIKQIIREEMDATGSQELMMTVLQPQDIWEKSNRWDDKIVDNWFKTKLLNGTELGVGLTHEEPIVDAAKAYISSHKDLPVSVYQIGNKFRNEKRAKSGLLRGREFIMKDAYTFARDQDQHQQVYEQLAEAYHKVYQRLGLGDCTYRVKADGGIFTKRYSDEFQTKSSIGEDLVFRVPETDQYFNSEIAPCRAPQNQQTTQLLPMEERKTPGVTGVEQLSKELNVPVELTVKTMIYVIDGKVTAVAVRGDYEVNEIKLRMALDATQVQLADESTVQKTTGSVVGYAGLIGLSSDIQIVADDSIENLVNFELGANKTDYHNVNVNWVRDIASPDKFYDVKQAKEGDIHPESGRVYETFRAVEVGNIFPLETKYTDALDLYYTDESGNQKQLIMGCYGIGVSRLMGVLAEHFADEKGLVWPEAVAPYRVYIVQIGDNQEVTGAASDLYEILNKSNVEVLWDDRPKARPGEKFADADLYGIPYRIVVSSKTIDSGEYEVKKRTSSELLMLTKDQIVNMFTS